MPLPTQLVDINLTGGMDSKTDAKLVLPSKLTRLENAQLAPNGTVTRRDGYEEVATGSVSPAGSLLGAPLFLALYGDELTLGTTQHLYSLSSLVETGSKRYWVDRGRLSCLTASRQLLLKDASGYHYGVTGLQVGGLGVYAWADKTNALTEVVRASVVDATTGEFLQYATSLYAPGTNFGSAPRVLYASGAFCLLYQEAGGALKLRTLSPATPGAWSAAVALVAAEAAFNACANGLGGLTVASHIGSDISVQRFTAAGASVYGPFTATIGSTNVLAVAESSNGALVFVAVSAGFYVLTTATNTWGTLQAWGLTAARAAFYNAGLASVGVVYEVEGSPASASYVQTASCATGGVSGAATLVRGCTLALQPFAAHGRTLLGVVRLTENTLYLVNAADGTVEARLLAGNASAPGDTAVKHSTTSTDKLVLPQASDVNGDGLTFSFPAWELNALNQSGERVAGACRLQVVDGNTQAVEVNGSLLISGARPSVYDGASVVEENFNWAPTILGAVAAGLGTGNLGAGLYSYTAGYEWYDGAGNLHRSALAPPVAFTATAGDTATLTVATLNATAKAATASPARGEVTIAVFRTEAGGSLYYRNPSTGGAVRSIPNNPAAASVTHVDNTADADIIGNPLLYTEGGVLEAQPLPACTTLAAHQKRCFAGGLTSPNETRYCRELVESEALAFSDGLYLRQGNQGGDVGGYGTLDDKLILFKATEAYALVGEGPNDTGGQNDFSLLQRISMDVGCSNPRSIVATPEGLMFQASGGKGIYLLGRDLQARYVGADVEAYNGQVVVDALLLASKNQVRFYCASGLVLVYDYNWRSAQGLGQWSVFTTGLPNLAAAALWGDRACFLSSSGHLFRETAGSYADAGGSPSTLLLETAWLKLQSLQGFQRVYSLYLLGTYRSAGTLTLSVGFDFADAYSYSQTVDLAALAGDTTRPVQLRHDLRQQKCKTVRFALSDSPVAPYGGFALTALTLEVGLKKGAGGGRPAGKVIP